MVIWGENLKKKPNHLTQNIVKKIEVELFPWEKLEYVEQLIKTLKK